MNNRSSTLILFLSCMAFLFGCTHQNHTLRAHEKMNNLLPEALSHGDIIPVTEDVYVVMGTNIIVHDGVRIQSSRTMTIIREQGELTLINAIRLNGPSLKELEKLGRITNVVRLGAFHGRDDAFYQQTYGAKLWASSSMQFSHGEVLDHDLTFEKLPLATSQVIEFKTTKFKEYVLLLERDDGVLITCDSIKNWQTETFFDHQTFVMMKTAGSIGPAKIDATWLQAMTPSLDEIKSLGDLRFSILISAHGEPLKEQAKAKVKSSITDALKNK